MKEKKIKQTKKKSIAHSFISLVSSGRDNSTRLFECKKIIIIRMVSNNNNNVVSVCLHILFKKVKIYNFQ